MTTSLHSNPVLPSPLRPCPSQPPPACSSPAAAAADHRARRRDHRAGQDKEEQERTRVSDRKCSGGLALSGLPRLPIPSHRLHRRPSQSNPSALVTLAAQAPPPSPPTPHTHPSSSSYPPTLIHKLNRHTYRPLRPRRHPRHDRFAQPAECSRLVAVTQSLAPQLARWPTASFLYTGCFKGAGYEVRILGGMMAYRMWRSMRWAKPAVMP